MNTYSRALKHIDMKDVKQKHQQKLIEQKIQRRLEREEKKYIQSVMKDRGVDWRKELNEQMTTSDVFFTTLNPPENTYDNPIVTSPTASISYANAINSNTRLITLGTFDLSSIDQFEVNATRLGSGGDSYGWALQANGTVIAAGGANDPIRVANASDLALFKSGSTTLTIRQTTGGGEAPNPAITGWTINNVKFYRTVPTNVFVSLDSPEATAFIRTEPNLSNLSAEERNKKLREMIKSSDEYLNKMFGSQFPGTGAVPPGESGDISGVQITNIPYQQPTTFTMGYDVVTDAGTQKATYTGTLKTDSEYQKELSAYEKAIAAHKQKADELSKAVDAARAEYLKLGQTVAQRQQSYNKLQAAIKAGTDHALSTLKNPIIPPKPPTQTPQKPLSPEQLVDIEKQIKDLQAQSEKNKQDAQINQWKAAGELVLGVAGVVGGIGALAKIPAAIRTAQTVSQVRQATKAYDTYKALEKIKDAAATRQMTRPGAYTAKPNPSRTPVKGGMMYKNSYEPEGEVISEKRKLKSPEEVLNKIPGYYDGKPAPLGFPETPPPKMVNGMHPDLVDGKNVANRFNRLDPESAKATPLTGNPHIDKKIKAARKQPK